MYAILLLCCIFILSVASLVGIHSLFQALLCYKESGTPSWAASKCFSGDYSEVAKMSYLESRAKWLARYGTTFICYFGIKPVIVTEDLEILKSIMVKKFDNFINRSYNPPLLRKEKVRGLLFSRDETWRRVRRILTPTFSSKKLRMMSPLIQESCERLRNKMAAVSDTAWQ